MNRIIILIFTVFLMSCEKNQTIQTFKKGISPDDIDCLNEIKKAENDLKTGINIYCKSYDMLINFTEERHAKEFDSILNSKNIKIKNAHYSDVVYENKHQNCYCKIMNLFFEEKHGTKYIDSIHFISDSIWVRKNPDLTFSKASVNGMWDKPALFPGDKYYDDEHHTGLQEKFDELFNLYDKNYITTNKENGNGVANIRIDIYVDKNGNASIKDHYITYFHVQSKKENYNKLYHESIKNLAFKLIKQHKWKPATVGNVNVNSEFSVIIELK